jgi:hypothetical protein
MQSVTFPSGHLTLSSPIGPSDPDNPTLTVPRGTYRFLARVTDSLMRW